MNNIRKKTKNLEFFLFILFTFFCLLPSYAMDKTENSERNWKSSLNLGNVPSLELDPWFLDTKKYINEDNIKKILGSIGKKPKYLPNIAKARFYIIYINEDKKEKKYFQWDLNRLFLSGQFDCDTSSSAISFGDSNIVISACSFLEKKDLDTSEFNKKRLNTINSIFDCNISSGTCSETSILEYIHKNINLIINKIIAQENGNKFEILGTITQISSFKDPCLQNCIPMLHSYMGKMHSILSNQTKEFTLSDQLENLVLLSGQKPHINSRNGMILSEDPINLNLENPSNRIFSKNNE